MIYPTERQLDDVAQALIPILDKVGDMNKNENVHGEDAPYHFVDQPESKKDYKPPSQEDIGFADTGGFALPEVERLAWAIQGQAVMVTSIPEPRPDGSYRIVLSPDENWDVQSVLMSGLDSSTEIELILVPRI